MSSEHPTGEQIRAVVAEVMQFNFKHPEEWVIEEVAEISGDGVVGELYTIEFTNDVKFVVYRHPESGKIEPMNTWSYYARYNFEDQHEVFSS